MSAPDLSYYPSLFSQRLISLKAEENQCLADAFNLRSIRSVGPAGTRWKTY
ncbi:hypothetical protein GCM10022280_12450 [Sphingomonas swuensis]|uniref:Uncharacterized protein n=1 Tax=Sphingomonas swuensis TaxID=977800 RepID=A0ABP7SRB1_9SPHN